ncbi:winged helix-turn-helix domain-containing protein [Hyphobacterium marinum]|uniref:Winged helix-turn-helix domain-containing protein n=1 Tax=Hyphobacterium marinum TaxID=3116574 RepID=A0ABU7LWZ5_9PROT|nr:winged helix-turn-helix domain-containing protein [Hyphobacterium sp. Y6023]MEE2566089.1 winged helix-turn-helix domain-containing protein [Hyphobacterium sp. Y6023]
MNTQAPISATVRGSRCVSIGEVIFDRDRSLLAANGDSIRLEPKVAGVLSILIDHGTTPVTRDELLDRVWGEEGSDEALTQAVSRLRRIAGPADLIVTVPRVGYQLATVPVPAGSLPRRNVTRLRSGPFRHVRASHVYSFAAGAASMAFVATLLFAVFIKREVNIETFETVPGGELVQVSQER